MEKIQNFENLSFGEITAFRNIASDIIKKVLESAGNPDEAQNYIVSRLREVYSEPEKVTNNIPLTLKASESKGQRTKAEVTADVSRKLLIEITDNSISPIYATDLDGRFLLINKRLESILGVPRESLIGKTRAEVLPPEIASQHWVNDLKVINELKQISIEEENIEPDGKHIYISVKFPLFNHQGNLHGVGGISTDITERKKMETTLRESEELFRKVFEEGPLGMAMANLEDGRLTSVNQALCNMLGYTREELLKLTFVDVTHPGHQSEDIEAVKKMLEGKIQCHNTEKRYLKKNGEVIWATRALTKISDIAGQDPYTLSMIMDITEKKLAEEEIKKNSLQLENIVSERTSELKIINKELEAFSYSVSHDLRAPLRSIDGFSQSLLEDYSDKLDDTGKNYLNRVRSAAQRMALLIDDMLNLARVTRTTMNLGSVDLSAIASAICAGLKDNDKKRSAEFTIEPGLNDKADLSLIRAALQNLFDNAWKFTSKNPFTKIEFGQTEIDNRMVYFIRDNGAGFNMEYAEKLFIPFQRLHQQKEFTGTGVGLATVQRIIHRHNGSIWAEGQVNIGATFYFTLNTK